MTQKYAKLHHIDFMHVLFFRDIFQFEVKPRGNSFENNDKHPVEREPKENLQMAQVHYSIKYLL